MQTKQCTRCGQIKPITEFHKDRSGRYDVRVDVKNVEAGSWIIIPKKN